MSVCNRCGTLLTPGSMICNGCGLPITMTPAIAFTAPPGTQKALIGTTPLYQVFFGVFAIILGIVALSVNSFFAPIAAILILIGIVFLVLGILGKPIYTQQVAYQTAPTPPSVYQAGAMKRCSQCGAEIMAASLACYKCGAVQ